MNLQKLFETINRITGHQCLESEMFEIIDAYNDKARVLSELKAEFESKSQNLGGVGIIFKYDMHEIFDKYEKSITT